MIVVCCVKPSQVCVGPPDCSHKSGIVVIQQKAWCVRRLNDSVQLQQFESYWGSTVGAFYLYALSVVNGSFVEFYSN